ncbi:Retinal pigment epithelial membrane protein [Synechococcus sp. PCC 7335]|uniref:carotenoid oxygenase family protein n=1 Tax=Synechococcus sp. (strain ATCC 29403 / PCC 7335) TaxID=91464 RepID=UPI00017EB529|nr:carotenoid oxygenase family protein [Synechococcus sp. PCC 7335]EDX85963.1 Retinal pigment epithelial membrane protein [Synechococcus sp. PCC 7335]
MQTLEAPNQPLSYTREDWTSGYRSQPEEFAYWIDDVEGEIPADLEGTVFRNGPGLTDINGYRLKHPFDGDGMINSIAFKGGKAFYRNKFVKTEAFIAEQKSGKPEYRGVFGTQKPGGWLANAFDLRLKNIANTHVVYWGGKLLALWEAAEPHRLDPRTLKTIGIDSLDGLLKKGDAFAAHPKFDPDCEGTQRMVNFGVKTGLSSTISLYEFTPDGRLAHQHRHSVPGFAFLHDFAITPNYCLFVQNPVGFNPLPFVFGFKGAAECIQFNPKQPTKIVLIPRDGKGEVRFFDTDSCFVFHHANAFEHGNQLILDSVCYDSFPTIDDAEDYSTVDFDHVPASQLWRFSIDLNTENVAVEKIIERPCEFPALNPKQVGRNYRYLFMGATDGAIKNAPLQALIKRDMQTGEEQLWSAAPRGFGGEPLFVARPGSKAEDDGWVLLWIFNAAGDRTELTIFNAQDITPGPIATLKLRHHIPYGLHGSFVSEYFGPETNLS